MKKDILEVDLKNESRMMSFESRLNELWIKNEDQATQVIQDAANEFSNLKL